MPSCLSTLFSALDQNHFWVPGQDFAVYGQRPSSKTMDKFSAHVSLTLGSNQYD